MRTRTKARTRAVEAVFEASQRGVPAGEVLARNPEVNEYALTLVDLAERHAAELGELLAQLSPGWPEARMPALDRAILRIALAELRYGNDIDAAVVISEAVEIASRYSTDDSAKFVNGVLAAAVK